VKALRYLMMGVGAVTALVIAMQLPEIRRYIKMKTM